MNLIKRLIKDEEGQGLVEYALIVGLIALACVFILTSTGTAIHDLFNTIKGKLNISAPTA